MKILFSGGGTLGPVTPLLAIKEALDTHDKKIEYLWIGTKDGPEKELIVGHQIPFYTIASGKLRRYWSFLNFLDIFKIIFGGLQSFNFLLREKPDVCISAGGFTSVPVHFSAWMLGIPTWIHQQDIRVGLANRIMSKVAKVITVSTGKLEFAFNQKKVYVLGNPVREDLLHGNKEKAYEKFLLDKNLPIVFSMGGGTGSMKINKIMVEAMGHLEGMCNVIHLTGKERPQEMVEQAKNIYKNYKSFQFFTNEMKDAYAVADVIVTRGGFGSLTEIAALAKPAIVIPKFGHQVENVNFLQRENAVILLPEETTDGNALAGNIKQLLGDKKKREELGKNIHALLPRANEYDILQVLLSVVKS
ncbi:MAG: UDP-N-acetylglucosamine--N-acetylmuramyl-(pentapeptide) pyrophosphoryl-undecaprenol N-acetylglucosamine transferase [Candidatus Magasanikbacteria bacterium]